MNSIRIFSTLVVFALLCGCSDADKGKSKIEGTASIQGAPIEAGEIIFKPVGAGPAEVTQIKNGKFSLAMAPGKKRVEITSTKQEGVAADGLPSYKSLVPEQYNVKSTLTADIADGKNAPLTFDLK